MPTPHKDDPYVICSTWFIDWLLLCQCQGGNPNDHNFCHSIREFQRIFISGPPCSGPAQRWNACLADLIDPVVYFNTLSQVVERNVGQAAICWRWLEVEVQALLLEPFWSTCLFQRSSVFSRALFQDIVQCGCMIQASKTTVVTVGVDPSLVRHTCHWLQSCSR